MVSINCLLFVSVEVRLFLEWFLKSGKWEIFPKFLIAKYLEERCYKELRVEHIKFINIVWERFTRLAAEAEAAKIERDNA
nr:hypothetical protein CFP56_66651 [Quercus suber]